MNIKKINLILQYFIPHHVVSRLGGVIASCRVVWIKNWLIKRFVTYYQVDMTEAQETNPNNYLTFNDFFTRALQTQARPIAHNETAIVSPVDGKISQLGKIVKNNLIQAKGKEYTLEQLLIEPELVAHFYDGDFITLYLSPRDYHRVHMPFTGKLRQMIYVPGNLFAVNDLASQNIPRLFGRNERLIIIFDTAMGSIALIMVGAMIVGGIKTVWSDVATLHSHQKNSEVWCYNEQNLVLQRGDEIGRFQLGSTVILLFSKNTMCWSDNIYLDDYVKMGQIIAKYDYAVIETI